jgi:hypothetical protein
VGRRGEQVRFKIDTERFSDYLSEAGGNISEGSEYQQTRHLFIKEDL